MERLQEIIQLLKTPKDLVPRVAMELSIELGAMHAEKHLEYTEAQVERLKIEALHIASGKPGNQAKVIAAGSEWGVKELVLKAEIAGIMELIRVLKKSQQFYADEARGLY